MLDPDDRVGDVCDDREQLEAIFDEQDGANLGDGMASSDSEAERERQEMNRDKEANAVVERANAALGLSQVTDKFIYMGRPKNIVVLSLPHVTFTYLLFLLSLETSYVPAPFLS